MKLTTRSETMHVAPQSQPERFTGEAGFRVLHTIALGAAAAPEAPTPSAGTPAAGLGTWGSNPGNASMVRFEPGARTHWHSHSGGQLLIVVEGEGWTQARGEEPISIGPGDTVSIAPDEVHWHGAKSAGVMAHIAVTVGKPTWLEESPALD
ncbi:MAG: hypothetical protein QOK05_277 [Chloroflexota bacterium]|jgi:quercetin dioxygenase-like cupin family protein|nr:hypothetical protein [Chloroflexota bacterium]